MSYNAPMKNPVKETNWKLIALRPEYRPLGTVPQILRGASYKQARWYPVLRTRPGDAAEEFDTHTGFRIARTKR